MKAHAADESERLKIKQSKQALAQVRKIGAASMIKPYR